MNEIIDPFKESLFNDKFKGILGDTIEIGIDSILTDDSLREIPIVNTIIGTFKFGQNIHDRNLLKQTMIFIQEFNNNSNNEKVQKYISKYKKNITNNPKKAEIELGRVMIILNRNIDDIKSSILAKLYLSYIENKIDWSKFCDLSEVNEKMFTLDIEILKDIYLNNTDFDKDKLHNYQRLVSNGLMKNDSKFDSETSSYGIVVTENSKECLKMELTLLGKQFARIIIN
ncbi:hypothetical protein [Intestinibacter bartlettii]|uniref:hypothetical protein n=1 Tax=Intestinibacter bartlettii TaxID=261299 RepID=UPI0011074601|nr:hypothetical protein [Intestinibacter bartlettii]MDU2162762.1 hypothetical protein [Intestinibacter bartlettii]MDU6822795.1 hypothetical protein [Intestinibacter bartlettii]MEE0618028.1 hypothetical protein [Intestinibacter bartlettii]